MLPETREMAAWLYSFCLPRYEHGGNRYGQENVNANPLHNLIEGAEEAADLLFYLRQAIKRLEPQEGRLRVYIAGPYRNSTPEGVDRNIEAARDAQAAIMKRGHTPFCPHMMTANFERHYPEIPDDMYLLTDLDWIPFCHRLLLLPGWASSEGAVAEKERAEELLIPIILSVAELSDNA